MPGLTLSRRSARRLQQLIREQGAAVTRGPGRNIQAITPRNRQWVQVTSTTKVANGYPGKWYRFAATAGGFTWTEGGDCWVLASRDGTPVSDVFYPQPRLGIVLPAAQYGYQNGRPVFQVDFTDTYTRLNAFVLTLNPNSPGEPQAALTASDITAQGFLLAPARSFVVFDPAGANSTIGGFRSTYLAPGTLLTLLVTDSVGSGSLTLDTTYSPSGGFNDYLFSLWHGATEMTLHPGDTVTFIFAQPGILRLVATSAIDPCMSGSGESGSGDSGSGDSGSGDSGSGDSGSGDSGSGDSGSGDSGSGDSGSGDSGSGDSGSGDSGSGDSGSGDSGSVDSGSGDSGSGDSGSGDSGDSGSGDSGSGDSGSGSGDSGSGTTEIIRTNLGSQYGTAQPESISLSEVTTSDNVLLVVCVAWSGLAVSGPFTATVTYGGSALTVDLVIGSGVVAGAICSLAITTGATSAISVTVTDSGGVHPQSLCFTAQEIAGLDNGGSPDQQHTASGSGSSPDSGTTGGTTYGREYCQGLIVTEGNTSDSDGSWLDGWLDGLQDTGSDPADIYHVFLCEGYLIASSSVTARAAKTGASSHSWSAGVQTYS